MTHRIMSECFYHGATSHSSLTQIHRIYFRIMTGTLSRWFYDESVMVLNGFSSFRLFYYLFFPVHRQSTDWGVILAALHKQ